MSLLQHPVGFSYPGGGADINFETPLEVGGRDRETPRARVDCHRSFKSRAFRHDFRQRAVVRCRGAIERQVEHQDIDSRLAEDPRNRGRVFSRSTGAPDPRSDRGRGQHAATWMSAAAGLISGSSPLPDVVTRSIGTWCASMPGLLSTTFFKPQLDRIDQSLVGRSEIRAARAVGVVALVAGGGRTG